MSVYGFDRFLDPIEIESGQNAVVVDGETYTLAPGTYYQVNQPSSFMDDRGLLSVTEELADALPFTFTTAWHAPEGYDYQESLLLVRLGGSPWTLNFDDAGFTLPPEILGFPPDIDEAVASEEVDGNNIIFGTRSALGSWHAGPIYGEHSTDWRSSEEVETYTSTDEIFEGTEVLQMREVRKIRQVEWSFVPGLRVQGGEVRGESEAYRHLANMGPINDGFAADHRAISLKTMWDAIRGGGLVICFLNTDQDQTNIDDATEYARLGTPASHAESGELFNITRRAGELYDVEITLLVIEGEAGY